MSDSVKEQLSAYLDGELADAELELLAKRLGRDTELRQSLGRYALITESLRGERPTAASRNFAGNVMSALDNEPAVTRSRFGVSPALARRLRPVAGFAVAASVAALAVISVQRGGMAPGLVADTETVTTPAPTLAAADPERSSYTVPTTTNSSAFVPAARLTNYVVAHSEYSSPLGRRTVLSGVLSEDDAVPEDQPGDQPPVVETQVTTP
jgi:sigma-E factor negative regulatory protein RseA